MEMSWMPDSDTEVIRLIKDRRQLAEEIEDIKAVIEAYFVSNQKLGKSEAEKHRTFQEKQLAELLAIAEKQLGVIGPR